MKQMKMALMVLALLALGATALRAATWSYPTAVNYNFGLKPTNYNAATDDPIILAKYDSWKANCTATDGTRRWTRAEQDNNYCYSEGISYGMMMSVMYNDQTAFNQYWAYKESWKTSSGLMHWKINAMSNIVGSGSATDADQDIAWALYLAHYRWGSGGTLNYLNLANTELTRIKAADYDVNRVKPGDSFNDCRYPSYFFPNQYTTFAKIDSANASFWNGVKTQVYTTLDAANNNTTGLWAEQCTDTGTGGGCAVSATNYQYNSCRIPFRLGMAYVYYGDAQAQTLLNVLNAWLPASGSGLADCHNMSSGASCGGAANAAFIGGWACGLMAQANTAANQTKLNTYYTATLGFDHSSQYYQGALQLLYLALLTGHWPNIADPATIYTPTRTPTVTNYAGTPSFTSTPTPEPSGLLYEDFETGAVPYVFSYISPDAGSSMTTPTIVYNSSPAKGLFNLRNTATIGTASGYGGFGFTSSNNDSLNLFDATGANRLRFYVKSAVATTFNIALQEGAGAGRNGDNESWNSANMTILAAEVNTWKMFEVVLATAAGGGTFTEDIYAACQPNCLTTGNNAINLDSIKALQIGYKSAPMPANTFQVDEVGFMLAVAYTPTATKTPFFNQYKMYFDDFESPLSLSRRAGTFIPPPFQYCGGASDTTTAAARFGWSKDTTNAWVGTAGLVTMTCSTGWGNSVWIQSPYSDSKGWFDARGAVYIDWYMNAPVGTKYQVEFQSDSINAANTVVGAGSRGVAWISKPYVVTQTGWQNYQLELGTFKIDTYTTTWTGYSSTMDLQNLRWISIKFAGNQPADPFNVYLDNISLVSTYKTPTPSMSPTQGAVTATHTRTIVPTATVTATPTGTMTRTASPSSTATGTPTSTRTGTGTASATASITTLNTATSTNTQAPSFTMTSTRTATPTSSGTATASASSTGTPTRTATGTQTSLNTATSTNTAAPSFTQTSTRTSTATSSGTATPSSSATSSASATPSSTRTGTPTSTYSRTATPSPTITETHTEVPVGSSPTNTPTITLSFTASPTSTRTATPSSSATASSSATGTPSSSITVSPTNVILTPTNTGTGTPSASITVSPTNVILTPTSTGTRTVTGSITASPTNVILTPTSTGTGTPSASITVSPTNVILTPTSTGTSTLSPTRTITETVTPGNTVTITVTYSSTASATPSVTPSSSRTVTSTFTQTSTGTASPTRSATPSSTGTNTPGNTPTSTRTATPSSTATASATVSSTSTATATRSVTQTNTTLPTGTLTQTPTITVSSTQTPTSTVIPGGNGEVDKVLVVPNPIFTDLRDNKVYFRLTGSCDAGVVVGLYTKGWTGIGRWNLNQPFYGAGWHSVSIPKDWLKGLSNGTYYLTVKTPKQSEEQKTKLVLLR